MFRSFSVKILSILVFALAFGFVVSVPIAAYLFQGPAVRFFQDEYAARSGMIADVYSRLEPDERESYLRRLSEDQGASFWVYDGNGLRHASGPAVRPGLTDADIRRVLDGAEVVKRSSFLPLPTNLYMAWPLRAADETLALVVHPERSGAGIVLAMTGAWVAMALIIGVLGFSIFAIKVVNPIKALTAAARKVAMGDYDITLRMNCKDELGVLSEQFRQMVRELSQLEQMRQEFVSNVSHEIQTPLASMAGFVSILQQGGLSEAEQRRCLSVIRQEITRLSRLGENMLRLAAIDSRSYPLKPSRVRLDRQLRHVVAAAEPQWAAKRLHVHLELPGTEIVADEDLLNQVWVNLLGNSIKFTPEDGDIFIELQSDGREIRVHFRDTGIGIAEEDRGRVFERFYMADKSRNREAGGNGLGLAIVKRVVELHNGSVGIDSEPGRGTAVTVRLPAEAKSRQSAIHIFPSRSNSVHAS